MAKQTFGITLDQDIALQLRKLSRTREVSISGLVERALDRLFIEEQCLELARQQAERAGGAERLALVLDAVSVQRDRAAHPLGSGGGAGAGALGGSDSIIK